MTAADGIAPGRVANGLSAAEARRLLERHGPNVLPRPPRRPALHLLLRQFTGALVLILFAAAAIASVLGDIVDTAAILLVIALNGALGFVQEWRAENAIEALQRILSPLATVRRDGRERRIPAAELVPGDTVILEAGDRVPADMTLDISADLAADESVLTGEALPVEKSAAAGDTLSMGTTVLRGRAEGTATATGAGTEFGRIAVLAGSVARNPTPLQQRLAALARGLGAAALATGGAVLAAGLLAGRDLFEMVMTGLSLAVAIVPEGLPAVVTITLALGASAMSRQRALARRLQAVETLGAATVICTDKTGTLTENRMTAVRIRFPDRDCIATGSGIDPAGHIECDGRRLRTEDDAALAALLEVAMHCNHARIARTGDGWTMTGDPTEGALVVLGHKGWAPEPGAILSERPFSSERKRMSVLAQTPGGPKVLMKGAAEQVLAACDRIGRSQGTGPLDEAARAHVAAAEAALAGEGLRVIAFAARAADGPGDTDETGLVFLGFVGLADPPRPEAAAAVAGAAAAGIRVAMITGDGPVTARAVAAAVGLPQGRMVTGPEIDALDEAQLADLLTRPVHFARTRPEQKLRIVRALQANGETVAMTGDGVNDAPALRQADIGVAMGMRGTDVAQDASDLVLMDDNFATILAAIREGRRQFDNIRKFVRYLLCSNAGEVVAILLNLLIGGPLVFLATQILWMNLVTDGVTAVALGMEKSEADQMRAPPRRRDAPVIGRSGLLMILGFGCYTGLASLWIFYAALPAGVDVARTAAFTAMIVFEKVSVFAFRSFTRPNWQLGVTGNPLLLAALALMFATQVAAVYWPPLQLLLHTVPLAAWHWLQTALFALPLIVVPELVKTVRRPFPASAPVATK